MFQPRSIHSSLSLRDKILSIDYILVISILINHCVILINILVVVVYILILVVRILIAFTFSF